jgi:anti-sigma factor RsiW
VDSKRLERWLHDIFNTQDEEISCTECLDLMSHYVEVELSDQDPAVELPQVRQHVEQCAACREEYETLRDIARLENEGGLPPSDELRNLIP